MIPLRKRWQQVTAHGLVGLAVVATVVPFLFTLWTSFKLHRDIASGTWAATPTAANYRALFQTDSTFLTWTLNSLVVALLTTTVTLFVGGLAAYSLSRFPWPRWLPRLLVGWLLVVHLIPPVTFIFPLYSIMRALGLFGTVFGIALGHVVFFLPLTVFILLDFFRSVPREIVEAARLDGADNVTLFWRIALPLVTGGIGAAGILTFIFSWREYAYALAVTSSQAEATLPVGVAGFAQDYSILYGQMAAASIIAVIPAIIAIVVAQRQIVGGLTLGAVVE